MRSAARLLWLCPLLGILVTSWILVAFGISLWTSLLATYCSCGPVLMIWGVVMLRKYASSEPKTRS